MNGRTTSAPARPQAGASLGTSTPRTDNHATPSPKHLPPHLRIRLMREQQQAVSRAQESQKRDAATSLPSPPLVTDVPSKDTTLNTTSSSQWTPARPTQTRAAQIPSESSSEANTPGGGAPIRPPKEYGRLTPPVFSPVQSAVDKKENVQRQTAEAVPKPTTVDRQPDARVQQNALRPSTNAPTQVPISPIKTHISEAAKKIDALSKAIVPPSKTTTNAPKCTAAGNHAANQPSTAPAKVENCATSSVNDPNAVNVWGTDSSGQTIFSQLAKVGNNPPKTEPEHNSTNPKDDTGGRKGLSTDKESKPHTGHVPLEQVQNKPYTRHDAAKPMPVPLATKEDSGLPKASPAVIPTPDHKSAQNSSTSIATDKNASLADENISFPHLRPYQKSPGNENVPAYPDPLRAHPVDATGSLDKPSPPPVAVAGKEEPSPEGVQQGPRDSRTTMWVQRMRRYRTIDLMGGRTVPLRDESQIHHDFYGYIFPDSVPTLTRAPGADGVTIADDAIEKKRAKHYAFPEITEYPPMEPTNPLYRLRMQILVNFGARCQEAKHRADVVLLPEQALVKEKETARSGYSRRDTYAEVTRATERTTEPKKEEGATKGRLCPLCAPVYAFTMREQHGQLFLESVLLPLSEATTYADMVVHINTSVAERIFHDIGMANARADDPAYPWEDIKTMPIYEDYHGALLLATHRRRVMQDLPMMVDDAGMIKGKK